ncbi:hypothetical protein FB567DRAFT_609962 [Paraphoma chrysanthemicola]|uniref:Uncharacterized protein n=1 Tax=Paraphoma chrysanthemicola TaxID=798071 RepID=A0A8K0RFB4_9PLEO|nr:hypothetical protein FB567DRAFT_609962 [Paraphoma chrysanthemicola]
MRTITLLGLLALQLAVPVLAISEVTDKNCSQVDCGQTEYFRQPNRAATAADPPKPAPRPPPPLPVPARPEPATQPASDALWDKSGAKGCTLGGAMQATDREAGALYMPVRDTAKSAFTQTSDLLKWYWYPFPRERLSESFHDLYQTWGIGWALHDLGISTYTDDYEGGKNIMVNIGHENFDIDLPVDEQWYGVGQRLYRATGASYTFTVNPEEGIIIALNRESPKWAAKDRRPELPDNLLPQLNQFSDVAWVTWKSMIVPPWSPGVQVNSLKYFMAVRITNVETRQILKRALDAYHWELSEWPGHSFERIWPETKAILGSPNVQGFAYFLIQHKAELGNMFIDKIQVFKGETKNGEPCILMHLRQPLGQPGDADEVNVKKRTEDGNTVREHTFRARL